MALDGKLICFPALHQVIKETCRQLQMHLRHFPACTPLIVSLQAEKAKSQALETACSRAQSEAKHSAMHLAQVIRHTKHTHAEQMLHHWSSQA